MANVCLVSDNYEGKMKGEKDEWFRVTYIFAVVFFSTIAKMLAYFAVALFFFSPCTSNPLLVILRKTVLR